MAIASVEEKGDGLAVVRRRAAASELPPAALTLAQHLVDKRLLVSSGGESGGLGQPAMLEVGHEAVFKHWQRFKDWEALYAADLAARQQAERAAAEWHKAGRPGILLWGWERQRPALEALRKLNHLPLPDADAEYADAGIALWRALHVRLPDTPLKAFLYPEPLLLIDALKAEGTDHQRREEIGLRLNQLPDPRRGVGLGADGLPDILWLHVPAGEVTIEVNAEPDVPVQSNGHQGPNEAPQNRFCGESLPTGPLPDHLASVQHILERRGRLRKSGMVAWPTEDGSALRSGLVLRQLPRSQRLVVRCDGLLQLVERKARLRDSLAD